MGCACEVSVESFCVGLGAGCREEGGERHFDGMNFDGRS